MPNVSAIHDALQVPLAEHSPSRKKRHRIRCPRIVAESAGLEHPARKRIVRRGTGTSRLSFRSAPSAFGNVIPELFQDRSLDASSLRNDKRKCSPPTPPTRAASSSTLYDALRPLPS